MVVLVREDLGRDRAEETLAKRAPGQERRGGRGRTGIGAYLVAPDEPAVLVLAHFAFPFSGCMPSRPIVRCSSCFQLDDPETAGPAPRVSSYSMDLDCDRHALLLGFRLSVLGFPFSDFSFRGYRGSTLLTSPSSQIITGVPDSSCVP